MSRLRQLVQEAHYLLKAKTRFDPFAHSAVWFKNLNKNQRTDFLRNHLPQWPQDAKQHFSQLAQDYTKHGLTAQDSLDLWRSSTGGTVFPTQIDANDYLDTVNWSKKQGWEPPGLKR